MKNIFKIKLKDLNIGGFSVPELLVSIGIIALVTTIVVYNQSSFTDQIALSNSATDVELQIREAQVYGVSVKDFRAFQGSTSDFSAAYGVTFNLTSAANPYGATSYYFFIDRVTVDRLYNATAWNGCSIGGASECIRIGSLSRGNTISRLCVITSAGTDVCGPTNIGRIDISFIRPDPNARFKFFNSSNSDVTSTYSNPRGAKIEIRSPHNSLKTVIVYSNGQISIQ